MIKLFLIIIFVLLQSCSKPKTVLICGDHECINKKEAKLYFEENLSLEVKIIDPKNKDNFDLVELNLKKNIKRREVKLQKRRGYRGPFYGCPKYFSSERCKYTEDASN